MRARLRYCHRLLALGLGGWIGVWLLAGTALLWQGVWQAPPPVQADQAFAELDEILAAAQRRHPQPGSFRLVLPRRPGEAVQAIFVADDLLTEADELVLWLDPHTAEILGETPAKTPLWQGLYRLHSSFLLGDRGCRISLGLGLVLACLVASGLGLWRPGRAGRSLPVLRHRALGLVILPPLLISIASGLMLSLPAGWLGDPPAPTLKAKIALASPTLDAVVQQVGALFPGYSLGEVGVPRSGEPWEIALHRPGALAPTWLRLYPDGRLESQAPNPRQWIYAIHTGQVAGTAGRLLLTLGGVGFAVQAAYGFRLWWQRTRSRRLAPHARGNKQQIA